MTTKSVNTILTLLLISVFAFPNSFTFVKTIILSITLFILVFFLYRSKIMIQSDTLLFYLIFTTLSSMWILWGMLNGGYDKALNDAFKLYIIYSLIICLLITFFQNGRYLNLMLRSFFVSAMIISVINITSFAEAISGLQFFPEWFKQEMSIGVGLHEGYSDVSANNINSLFFIVPIIYAVAISNNSSINYPKIFMWLLLIVSMFTALLSGRRALIILLFLIPFIYKFQAFFVLNKKSRKKRGIHVITMILLYLFPLIAIYVLYSLDIIDMADLVNRLCSAFAGDTVRVDQYKALMEGFSDKYILGSGFGGSVSVKRSSDRPWMYELTYIQMLFNGGLAGFGAVFTLFGFFYVKAIISIRQFCSYQEESLALLTGFLVFCIASASNPYFSSFDTLFILGTLPLISGWRAYSKKYPLKGHYSDRNQTEDGKLI